MRFQLQPRDEEAIRATLAFANMERVDTDEEVEQLFEGAMDLSSMSSAKSDYAQIRDAVRDWLESITRSERGCREVWDEVARFSKDMIHPEVVLSESGRREMKLDYYFDDVDAVVVFAVALILDEGYGLKKKLQRCVCGRFNLDFKPKGRPRKYCSAACAARANYEGFAGTKSGPQRTHDSRKKHSFSTRQRKGRSHDPDHLRRISAQVHQRRARR